MKSPLLGFALSTVAFGAASVYLWIQLDAERAQAANYELVNQQLDARLQELERQRAEFAERRMAHMPPVGGAMTALGPPPGNGPAPEADDGPRTKGPNGFNRAPPEMPAAMLKMMRSNMRAQNKRLYFDLQSKLGLTDEQNSALLDLLADQQAQGFRNRRNQNPDDARASWEAEQAKRKSDIVDLLGSSKATEFEEYQKTMPARSELMMISQQLEGVETPLNDDQRTRMLTALVEERERIPVPTYSDGTAQEEMQKNYNEWQTDYEKRVADRARGILSSEQLATYSEYQNWQKEMREQFAAQGPGALPLRGPRGNAMFLAAPAGGVAFAVSSDTVSASPTEKSPQPK